MDELIVATDFSGLGSPEEALKRLQVKHSIAFACDKDGFAKKSYLANHSPGIFYDDITKRNQAETPTSDLYCFGFPCQAFSLAGNRKGFEDTRGTLFFNSLSYIKERRPRVFIAENVKGLLSHDKGKTFGVIRDALGITVNAQINLHKYEDCIGYHIFYKVLNSKKYGIPQNRERIFIIGFRDWEDGKNFKFPKEFKLNLRLKDMLEDNVDEKYFLSKDAISWILSHREKRDSQNDFPIDREKRDSQNDFPIDREKRDVIPTLNARYFKRGAEDSYILEPTIVEHRGHKNSPPKFIENGIVPTIRAESHGHETKIIVDDSILFVKENTAKGYTEAYEFDSINLSNPNSKTRRGRVGKQIAQTLDTACNQAVLLPLFDTGSNAEAQRIYDSEGIARTLKSESGGQGGKTGLYRVGSRIRRLTPREVFKLMGYSDDFYEVCRALNSDTQLYKQGGNSIVVDTIMWILVEVCRALNIPYVEPEMR